MSLPRVVFALAVAAVLGLGAYQVGRMIRGTPAAVVGPAEGGSEVAWMIPAFGLSEQEFRRVEELHLAYVPRCDEYCCRIAGAGERVRRLASTSTGMTPELAAALKEDERTRATCRQALLDHLYQTAACMAPEKGRRFLEMALPKVLAPPHPDVHSAVSH